MLESPFSEATKKSGNKKIKKLVIDERTKKLVIKERKKLVIKVRNKFGDERKKKLVIKERNKFGDERKKKLVKKKEKFNFCCCFLNSVAGCGGFEWKIRAAAVHIVCVCI